jgi:protein-tyrosine-phosphatase
LFFGLKPPSPAQLESAGILVIALLFLSPMHHFDRVLAKLRKAIARPRPESAGLAPQVLPSSSEAFINSPLPPRLFLFVCSGNTCRSPMAAAIANNEIASRLGIPFESANNAHLKARSAGVTAKVGEPMTNEAKEALHRLGFHPNGHRAEKVTSELAHEAEKIFCMTQAHQNAVIELVPGAALKTQRLDPDNDIEDPIGSGLETYVQCAQRIHALVGQRLDESGITGLTALALSRMDSTYSGLTG